MSYRLQDVYKLLVNKPLSLFTFLVAAGLTLIPSYQRIIGNYYLESLNYVDVTTLIMVGILLLWGVIRRRFDTDLQAVSIALVGALSFVFAFEALYKLSFYTFPWRMPPEELREFVIQAGITLTGLVGFAFGRYKITRISVVLLVIFLIGWIFWLLIGFPQLYDGEKVYPAVLNVHFTWDMIYALNRGLKFVLFMIYFSFYQ